MYWCPVPPPPPPGYAGAAAAAAAAEAARSRHGRGLHLATPRRAAPRDAPPAGAYVRVHARPKLFPAAAALSAAEWAARIVAVGGGGGGGAAGGAAAPPAAPPAWAILDKPPGVPSVPTVDNGVQHALAGAEVGLCALGIPLPPPPPPWPEARQRSLRGRAPPPLAAGTLPAGGRLAAAHRLDQAASGLLVLAVDRAVVHVYSTAAAAGGVAKLYRAAVARARAGEGEGGGRGGGGGAASGSRPPLGPLTHWAARGGAAAAAVAAAGAAGPARTHLVADGAAAAPGDAARCDLVVLGRRRLVGRGRLASPAAGWAGEGGDDAGPWEVSILLKTGRTHQIRAQLAAVGWPILGDGLYGGRGGAVNEAGRADPASPVCLQAARLEVRGPGIGALYGEGDPRAGAEGGMVAFEAGVPWWRGEGADEEAGEGEGEWEEVKRWL